jgi:hypothetical protein
MNIDNVDRIIITSYERIEIIIRWYLDNKELLSDLEFIAPLKKGFVELQTEGFDFAFESKGRTVHIDAYETAKHNLIFGFDYNPHTLQTSNLLYYIPKNQIPLWRGFVTGDNSLYKLSVKYHALMMFMAHYREYVTAKEKSPASKSKPKAASQVQPSENHTHTNSLVRKVYYVDGFRKSDIRNLGEKFHHSSPSYEFEVRGFYRHYKSGKVVWVDGFTKGKGKGPKKNKKYKL